MSDNNSLVNLGDISEPATVLIKKVSNAIGLIYEPHHVRRMAKAEADAQKIRALAQMEINELEQRAIERLVRQEARKQENIEAITAQATSQIPEDAHPENLDEDWVANFFNKCDTVSDAEMQSLWARLLSGEATRPGTYSKRTVELVSTLDKADAELFSKFCQFIWSCGDLLPLVFDTQNSIYTDSGITFSAIQHLDAIGLVSFEPVASYVRTGFGKYAQLFYYGRPLRVEFSGDSNNQLETGHIGLTSVGRELAPIAGSSHNEVFYHYVVEHWHKKQLILSSMAGGKAW
jgi:hypothetical protein